MRGSPIADDESAYRFASELLARGRLWVPSPPLKLFFDQNFIINDGRMYTVYFLGWPALLVPATLAGLPEVANPIYSALTIPPLWGVLRHYVGPLWSRAGVLLFLVSPFVQVMAATELSHTTCLMALTWCLFFYVKIRDGAHARDARLHAAMAVSFSIAFFIRPQAALALGLPLLIGWAWRIRSIPAASRGRCVSAFVVPSMGFGVAFLSVLWLQNGSPFLVGYGRYAQYLVENGFAFSSFRPVHLTTVPGFYFGDALSAVVRVLAGLFRLNFDLFGWPTSLGVAIIALRAGKDVRLLWAMAGTYLGFFFFQTDWGIDTFGPVHGFELALPILILTILGAERLTVLLGGRQTLVAGETGPRWSLAGPGLLVGLTVAALAGFVPVRWKALHQITGHIAYALDAPEKAGITNAVVFSPRPFVPSCEGVPHHFVGFRPVNDPWLEGDILWVNDLGFAENLELMNRMPDRKGYVMRWIDDCEVELSPLVAPPRDRG